jgi:holin-like protein
MKYLRQFFLILLFSLIGELLHYLIPLQIPGSIYGLILLLIALLTGLIQLSQVRETGKFLIEIMPLMFVPAGVGLMESWGELQPILIPVVVILIVSTVLVMGVSGRVTQAIIRLEQKRKKKTNHEQESRSRK